MAKAQAQIVAITPPNMQRILVPIVGEAPLVIHRFSLKSRLKIQATQEAGSTSRKGAKREARDFDADFEGAKYNLPDGTLGVSASCFRNAMISACRVAGFQMTKAKLAVFIEPDGFDKDDGTPLVRVLGNPEKYMSYVRNETGVVDLRCRPMWREWRMDLRVAYDGDLFTATDVVNLIARAGAQVGIGEGRPDSKKSAGLGFGLFRVDAEASAAA